MTAPPKAKPRLTPPKSKAPAPPKQAIPKDSAVTKTFAVKSWTGAGEGDKVLGYGAPGLGKTTLYSMMPGAIFIGTDDGGRRIINPKTEEPINHIPGIETFADVRAAIQQTDLWSKGSSCVIDTATMLELWIERHVLETVPLPKGGGQAKNLKHYGWNDGSAHVLDAFRLLLQDLDGLIRRGVNVGLICQEQAITIANPEGSDFLQATPKLHHDRQHSVMLEACEWADHVFRVSYLNAAISAEGDRVGKATSHDMTRAIFIGGAQYYKAKSRTLGRFVDDDGNPIECIAFDNPADDSLWTFLFGEK